MYVCHAGHRSSEYAEGSIYLCRHLWCVKIYSVIWFVYVPCGKIESNGGGGCPLPTEDCFFRHKNDSLSFFLMYWLDRIEPHWHLFDAFSHFYGKKNQKKKKFPEKINFYENRLFRDLNRFVNDLRRTFFFVSTFSASDAFVWFCWLTFTEGSYIGWLLATSFAPR
jgi:hypothetical protein